MAQWRALIDIPGTRRGPAAARAVVGAILPAWGLGGIRDEAVLVVSELVTNAVEHAPGADSYELEVVRRSDGVRLSLADGSSVRPLIKQLNHETPRGRGMAIVAALSANWGADDHHGGKRVWVDLDVSERP